jgi:hypothetical protein
VDLHVDDKRGKLAKRVKLTSIIVRPHDEIVSCFQRWVQDDDAGDPVVKSQNFVLDADCIFRVTSPSMFDIEACTPFGLDGFKRQVRRGAKEATQVWQEWHNELCDAVLHFTERETGVQAEDILGSTSYHASVQQARYMAMLILHDMTQLTNPAITNHFGYKSPMPMVTAQEHIDMSAKDNRHGPNAKHAAYASAVQKRIRKIAADVDLFIGTAHRREPASDRLVLR